MKKIITATLAFLFIVKFSYAQTAGDVAAASVAIAALTCKPIVPSPLTPFNVTT